MREGKIPFQCSRTLGYRKGPDGKPEIDPDEAETVQLIYTRYLEGRSLGDIQKELVEKDIPTAEGMCVLLQEPPPCQPRMFHGRVWYTSPVFASMNAWTQAAL